MGWRSVMISHPTKLSVKNRQVKITQDEEWSIPMEDISTIVLETPQVNMSAKFISELAENKIVMYSCNDKHLPNGIFMPFANHSRQLNVIKQQLGITESFKKRCWQNIIIKKIENQAEVLKIVNKKIESEYLIKLSEKVNSGDTENKEGIAAKFYFTKMFGKQFNRNREDTLNISLNYGYAILRGCIARTIVAYGYLPSIGIHHKSELNNYNLADDFIEPFRQIVDLCVFKYINEDIEFDKNIRAMLVNLLNVEIIIDNKVTSVTNAIEIMVASYTTAIQNKDFSKFKIPSLIDIRLHEYE